MINEQEIIEGKNHGKNSQTWRIRLKEEKIKEGFYTCVEIYLY